MSNLKPKIDEGKTTTYTVNIFHFPNKTCHLNCNAEQKNENTSTLWDKLWGIIFLCLISAVASISLYYSKSDPDLALKCAFILVPIGQFFIQFGHFSSEKSKKSYTAFYAFLAISTNVINIYLEHIK